MVNEWARKHGRYFLSAGACGLFAYIFLDCGINFKIADATGEKCKEVIDMQYFILSVSDSF